MMLPGSRRIQSLTMAAMAFATPLVAQTPAVATRSSIFVAPCQSEKTSPTAKVNDALAASIANGLRDVLAGDTSFTTITTDSTNKTIKKYNLKPNDISPIVVQQLTSGGVKATLFVYCTYDATGKILKATMTDANSREEFPLPQQTGEDPKVMGQAVANDLIHTMRSKGAAASCNKDGSDAFNLLGTDSVGAKAKATAALAECDQVLAVATGSFVAMQGKARALRALDRKAEAIPLYRQVLAADPANSDALVSLGVTMAALKQFDSAYAYYRTTLSYDQIEDPVRWGQMATALSPGGGYSFGEKLMTAGLKADTSLGMKQAAAEFYFNSAFHVLYQNGNSADSATAKVAFAKAADLYKAVGVEKLNPDFFGDWIFSLGQVNRPDESVQVAKAIVAFKPTDAGARFALAQAEAGKGDWAAAIADYNEIKRIQPDFPQPMDLLIGRAHYYMGHLPEAKTSFDAAVKADPTLANKVLSIIAPDAQKAMADTAAGPMTVKKYEDASALWAMALPYATSDATKAGIQTQLAYVVYLEAKLTFDAMPKDARGAVLLQPAKDEQPIFEGFQAKLAQVLAGGPAIDPTTSKQFSDALAAYVANMKAVIKYDADVKAQAAAAAKGGRGGGGGGGAPAPAKSGGGAKVSGGR